MSPVSWKMVRLNFLKKKRPARVPMLFTDPLLGLALARRIAWRRAREARRVKEEWMAKDFCSQREGSAGDGGERNDVALCPGSTQAAAEMTAGAGCNVCQGSHWVPGPGGVRVACECRDLAGRRAIV